MLAETTSQIISRRYILYEPLGSGGMGAVYRAGDRLTGQNVALKRVLVPGERLMFASFSGSSSLTLALAQEFKVLASLRHPNIISVLDYGFDEFRQPYFTMELLENTQTLVDFGQDRPLAFQINLLLQMLQALVYLHRRGVLHRDLKPGNVAVTNGRVKVLDFGLSVVRGETARSEEAPGTLAYMSPEVLQGGMASEQSDLYAVGVMAYELLIGRHPFYRENVTSLIHNIMYAEPEVASEGLDTRLSLVLQRLLMKQPEDRYGSAPEVIHALCDAADLEVPPETAAIRDSFLQSAHLVGREAELRRLSDVLKQASNGQGGVWLIGGESGVGKSRFMDELRTMALVQGVLVVRGQAVSDGGSPYQLWHDALRWLALFGPDDFEASVLKALVPDISTLIGREVVDPPELDPQATQDRLMRVIENVFRRTIEQPGLLIMLLLEDIHWADNESLKVLRRLMPQTRDSAFLILCNYRDDERPNLPETLPGANILRLERLTEKSIAELSASMLGEGGREKGVISLLQRETEGNVFFLVEVVRALAEEAGQLSDIGRITLPESVFAGGMQRLIQRRLERIPDQNRPMLQFAAFIGRLLDLSLLRALNLVPNLEQWLTDGADVAVLDVQDGNWRFAHDKLREGLLADLSPEIRRDLHQRIAEIIEAVYPAVADQVIPLAYHWRSAGDVRKERHYTALAGEQALANGANRDAIDFFERAIALYRPSEVTTAELAGGERNLGEAYYGLGRMPQSFAHLARCVELLGHPVPPAGVRRILSIVRQAGQQGMYRLWPSRFTGRAHDRSASLMEAARAYERIAEIMYFRNHMFGTVHSGLVTLNLAETASEKAPEILRAYSTNSVVITLLRAVPISRSYGRRARRMAEALDHPPALQWAQMLEGMNYEIIGEWEKSEEIQLEAIETARKIGSAKRWSESTYQLAYLKYYCGKFEESYQLWNSMVVAAEERGDPQAMVWGLQGQLMSSIPFTLADESLSILETLNVDEIMEWDNGSLINVYGALASVHFRRAEYEQALDAAQKGLGLIKISLPTSYFTLAGYAGIAEVSIRLWEVYRKGLIEGTPRQYRNLARDGIAAARRFVLLFPIAQPFVWRWRGLLHWLAGRPGQAAQSWTRSLKHAQHLRMPYEEALTHYEMGRHATSDDPKRPIHLQRAAEIFEQLGAVLDAEQAQSELNAIEIV